jgi:WD40 repeat protein
VDVLSFSPRGDQIATGSSDNTIRLWNAETGVCTHTYTGHTSNVYDVAYSPQGNQLASAGGDSTVRLWDVGSGECSHILIGHTVLASVMYSPDGSKVFSRSFDSIARIWDAETGACGVTLTGHNNIIYEAEFSPQGNQVATSSADTTVRVWDVGTGECLHILIGHGGSAYVGSVTYSSRGDQIASGASDGSMKVWDLEAKTCLWTLTGHTAWINRIVYTPLGDLVISASNDKSVRLWDIASGQCRAVIQDFQGGVIDTVWIADSDVNRLVACCDDGLVGMWELAVDEDHCDVSLRWMTTRGGLDVKDASLQDVQGLSQLNSQLLKQRGAVGEPIARLGEVGKKLTTMAAVVSKLKPPLSGAEENPSLTGSTSVEALKQMLEKAREPLWQDLMAAIFKNIQ